MYFKIQDQQDEGHCKPLFGVKINLQHLPPTWQKKVDGQLELIEETPPKVTTPPKKELPTKAVTVVRSVAPTGQP